MAREKSAGEQPTVVLSGLAVEAMTAGGPDAAASARLGSALRRYLEDRELGRPAWRYPGFLRGSESVGGVEVEPGLWRRFAAEAARQDVAVERLAEHAAFYFAAEMDAGRAAATLRENLRSTEAGGEGEGLDPPR